MKKMVATWRKNQHQESPSATWMKIDLLEKKKRNVKVALSTMKSAETNLEGNVQLLVLICFFFIPICLPNDSGLGSNFEHGNRSRGALIIVVGSPIATLISNVAATIYALDMGKDRQLSVKSKVIIGLYILFQLASNFFRIIPTILFTLGSNPALSLGNAAVLLVTPIIINLCVFSLLMPDEIKKLPHRMFYLMGKIPIDNT